MVRTYIWVINEQRNAMNIIAGFKPVAKSDNGVCERCGTLCPKQTVIMASCDQDGNVDGMVTNHWGVCCAAQYCFGTKSDRNRKRVLALVEKAEQERKMQTEAWDVRIAVDCHTVAYIHIPMGIHAHRTERQICRHNSIREAANVRYMKTGLPRVGSFLMANDQGHEVRVLQGRAGEIEYYASKGFAQVTQVVAA